MSTLQFNGVVGVDSTCGTEEVPANNEPAVVTVLAQVLFYSCISVFTERNGKSFKKARLYCESTEPVMTPAVNVT